MINSLHNIFNNLIVVNKYLEHLDPTSKSEYCTIEVRTTQNFGSCS